jgi:hypothetical protein
MKSKLLSILRESYKLIDKDDAIEQDAKFIAKVSFRYYLTNKFITRQFAIYDVRFVTTLLFWFLSILGMFLGHYLNLPAIYFFLIFITTSYLIYIEFNGFKILRKKRIRLLKNILHNPKNTFLDDETIKNLKEAIGEE